MHIKLRARSLSSEEWTHSRCVPCAVWNPFNGQRGKEQTNKKIKDDAACGLYTSSAAHCTSFRDTNSDSVLPRRNAKWLVGGHKSLRCQKKKKRKNNPSLSSLLHYLQKRFITVSALRSSFDTNRVPDWHEKKTLRKRGRETKRERERESFTCNTTTSQNWTSHRRGSNRQVGARAAFRWVTSSWMRCGWGKLGGEEENDEKRRCWLHSDQDSSRTRGLFFVLFFFLLSVRSSFRCLRTSSPPASWRSWELSRVLAWWEPSCRRWSRCSRAPGRCCWTLGGLSCSPPPPSCSSRRQLSPGGPAR